MLSRMRCASAARAKYVTAQAKGSITGLLNLLTAIIIYWNTIHIGHAVAERQREGLDVPPELLAHISPLGWAHILLTGEYLWPKP